MLGWMIFDIVPGRGDKRNDLIRQVNRLFDAMGDEDHGFVLMAEQIQQLFLKLAPGLLID